MPVNGIELQNYFWLTIALAKVSVTGCQISNVGGSQQSFIRGGSAPRSKPLLVDTGGKLCSLLSL